METSEQEVVLNAIRNTIGGRMTYNRLWDQFPKLHVAKIIDKLADEGLVHFDSRYQAIRLVNKSQAQ